MSIEKSPAPAASTTRQAVRDKAMQVHAAQSRARVFRRVALALVIVAAVAAVAVIVTSAVSATMNRPQLSPSGADGDGFAISAAASATPAPTEADATAGEETAAAMVAPAVTIQVYVDYLSPGSREWQLANASQLASWVSDGAVALSYHPVSMLTAKSNGTKYSLRAASAAACVATQSPASFFGYQTELLTKQPTIDSDGLSDSDLADLAIAAGAEDPKSMRACIEQERYAAWVKGATERAVAGIDGTELSLTGTPMIIVNGQQYVGALGNAAEFSQFVLTSASGAFQKSRADTASPTPTTTP